MEIKRLFLIDALKIPGFEFKKKCINLKLKTNTLLYDGLIFVKVKTRGVLNYHEIFRIITKPGCKRHREKNPSHNKDLLWPKY